MSIDGTGILETDLAHNIYNEILDLEIYLAGAAKAYWETGVRTKHDVVDEFRRIHDDRTVLGEELIPLKEFLRQ